MLKFTSAKSLKVLIGENPTLIGLISVFNSVNSENAWYTLIGLKLLEQNFVESKPVWLLIAAKGRKALKLGMGIDVDLALTLLQVELGHQLNE